MNTNTPINYEFSIVKVLSLADSISARYGLSCVTDIVCFAALLALEDCPLHKTLLERSCQTEQEIKENGRLNITKVREFNLKLIQTAITTILNNTYSVSLEQEIDEEISFTIVNFTVYVSKELNNILKKADVIARESYNAKEVGCNHLLVAFCETLPDAYSEFLKLCNATPIGNNPFKEDSISRNIPRELLSCLDILNDEFSRDEKFCPILGRDEETLKLMRVLAKNTKRNAVLIGEPGVGKTALVEKLTWSIVTGNCPAIFKDSIIVSLSINSMIAGTKYRGQAEERFDLLIKFLEKYPNIILFVDEIHNLLGAGACRDGDLDLANALKPILARGKTQVIGATTSDEYERYFSRDGALKRRFEKIIVAEPKIEEVYPMIENKIRLLSEAHNVSISKELVDKIIFYASCFNYETKNPDRTLDLIDKSMAVATLSGKSVVSFEDVKKNFETNNKIFDKTPLNVKIALAYHEAGHYIVHRFSEELYDYKILAVSIMPADNYYGVNVFEIDSDIMPSRTREYYIQLIAAKLAGRVAEKLFSNKLSAGAQSDLKHATKLANDMVTRYALDETFSQSRVYLSEDESSMYSDEMKKNINERIDVIVEEARFYAEKLLEAKREYLELLVQALLEKGMLSAKEIDDLFKKM